MKNVQTAFYATKSVAWRLLQLLVVVPFSLVGGIILVLAATGHDPVQNYAVSLHEWIDKAVRPAPAGFVLSKKCTPQVVEEPTPHFVCEPKQLVPISIEEDVELTRRFFIVIYVQLVLFSALSMVVARPVRQWFGTLQPERGFL